MVVDGFLLGVLAWVIAYIIQDTEYAGFLNDYREKSPSENYANLIYAIVFIIIFTGSKLKGTPGKIICNIQVVNTDMTQISMVKSIGRFFALLLSVLTLFVGFMIAGWNAEKRALHDMICSTRVVYRKKEAVK